MKEKETIKLLHLCSDVMNLYGEYANLLSLKRLLEKVSGKECKIICPKNAAEAMPFDDFDMIYMGAGTEKAQKRALEELLPCSEAIKEAAQKGSILLFTGNAWELLGKKIKSADGKTYDCLGCFDFETEETKKRITGDAVCDNIFRDAFALNEDIYKLLKDNPTIGFINKCTEIRGKDKKISCFRLLLGMGDDNAKGDGAEDGGYSENIFGTHLIGPLLIKNPHLLKFFAYKIFINRDETECADKALQADTVLENKAYLISLNELKNRISQESR